MNSDIKRKRESINSRVKDIILSDGIEIKRSNIIIMIVGVIIISIGVPLVNKGDELYPILKPADMGIELTVWVIIAYFAVMSGLALIMNIITKKIQNFFLLSFVCILGLILLWGIYNVCNGLLDDKDPRRIAALIIHRETMPRSNSKWIYIKSIELDATYKFSVPFAFYKEVKVGDQLVLYIKPGFFGKRWISSYEIYKVIK